MYQSGLAIKLCILALASLLARGAIGCELIDYSPHQDDLPDGADQLTSKNIARIQHQPDGSQVRIAFITDTQNYWEATRDFIGHVNRRDDIDFVVHGGDIIQFGIIQEYEWIYDLFEKLDVPYVTVIGNHDLRGGSGRIYEQVFGPRNYSFVWRDRKFIFLDTNSLHYGFNGEVPDLDWLAEQLAPSRGFNQAVVVSHTPPYREEFDSSLESPYTKMLESSPLVQLSLHGHEHRFSAGQTYGDVLYLVGDNADDRNYLVITLADDGVSYERVRF